MIVEMLPLLFFRVATVTWLSPGVRVRAKVAPAWNASKAISAFFAGATVSTGGLTEAGAGAGVGAGAGAGAGAGPEARAGAETEAGVGTKANARPRAGKGEGEGAGAGVRAKVGAGAKSTPGGVVSIRPGAEEGA
jgi:hypothetical protein